MKKVVLLGLSVLVNIPMLAMNEEDMVRMPNLITLASAFMTLANQLITVLPGFVHEIVDFPSSAEDDVLALENAMKKVINSTGDLQKQQIQQLFIEGVDLTVHVTSIVNSFLNIVSLVTPVVEAFDPADKAKIVKAMQLVTNIMQMISTINVIMKNSIIESLPAPIQDQTTPQIVPV